MKLHASPFVLSLIVEISRDVVVFRLYHMLLILLTQTPKTKQTSINIRESRFISANVVAKNRLLKKRVYVASGHG